MAEWQCPVCSQACAPAPCPHRTVGWDHLSSLGHCCVPFLFSGQTVSITPQLQAAALRLQQEPVTIPITALPETALLFEAQNLLPKWPNFLQLPKAARKLHTWLLPSRSGRHFPTDSLLHLTQAQPPETVQLSLDGSMLHLRTGQRLQRNDALHSVQFVLTILL